MTTNSEVLKRQYKRVMVTRAHSSWALNGAAASNVRVEIDGTGQQHRTFRVYGVGDEPRYLDPVAVEYARALARQHCCAIVNNSLANFPEALSWAEWVAIR